MLRELAKYASASERLRNLALEKRAGVFGSAVNALKAGGQAIGKSYMGMANKVKGPVLGAIARNPGTALGVGLGVGTGVPAAVGKYRQNKAGFDPETHKMMLGQAPTPPGA